MPAASPASPAMVRPRPTVTGGSPTDRVKNSTPPVTYRPLPRVLTRTAALISLSDRTAGSPARRRATAIMLTDPAAGRLAACPGRRVAGHGQASAIARPGQPGLTSAPGADC